MEGAQITSLKTSYQCLFHLQNHVTDEISRSCTAMMIAIGLLSHLPSTFDYKTIQIMLCIPVFSIHSPVLMIRNTTTQYVQTSSAPSGTYTHWYFSFLRVVIMSGLVSSSVLSTSSLPAFCCTISSVITRTFYCIYLIVQWAV